MLVPGIDYAQCIIFCDIVYHLQPHNWFSSASSYAFELIYPRPDFCDLTSTQPEARNHEIYQKE